MPQKKNPHSLERIKALAGQAVGWFPGIMASQHAVVSTDLNFAFGDDVMTGMGDAALQCLDLSIETIRTLNLHEARMADAAGAFWSTTSHLADELVRRYDLTFRAAHHIVGRLVRDSINAGRTPADVRAEDLVTAGREMAGVELDMSVDELRGCLDARAFLSGCTSEGSVNPAQTRTHVEELSKQLTDHRAGWQDRRQRAEAAIDEMLQTARRLAEG